LCGNRTPYYVEYRRNGELGLIKELHVQRLSRTRALVQGTIQDQYNWEVA